MTNAVKRRSDLVRDGFLIALVAAGGALDAASYLRLHAFTANMTGNTVLLGLALGGLRAGDIEVAAVAVAGFAAGASFGALLGRESSDADPWPATLVRPFALEVVLLAAFATAWAAPPRAIDPRVLLALGACAMGAQSAITHDVHRGGASTTYMSGTLARAMEYLIDSLRFGLRGAAVLNGVAWIVYLIAASLVGTLAAHRGNTGAAAWAVVAIVAVVMFAAPPIVRRSATQTRRSSGA